MKTYTRAQAMQRLGITSPMGFHQLRRMYPLAFVVVQQGEAPAPTLYDAEALDKLVEIREELTRLKDRKDEPC